MSDFAQNRFPTLAPPEPQPAYSRTVPLQALPLGELYLFAIFGLALILLG